MEKPRPPKTGPPEVLNKPKFLTLFTQPKIYTLPEKPTTWVRLKKFRPSKPRPLTFLTQSKFFVLSKKYQTNQISYNYSKKPTQPKFLILSRKFQYSESVPKI